MQVRRFTTWPYRGYHHHFSTKKNIDLSPAIHDVDGGNSVLEVTDALGFADIDFVTAGDNAMLMWTGTTGWALLGTTDCLNDSTASGNGALVDIAN